MTISYAAAKFIYSLEFTGDMHSFDSNVIKTDKTKKYTGIAIRHTLIANKHISTSRSHAWQKTTSCFLKTLIDANHHNFKSHPESAKYHRKMSALR